MEEDNLPIPDDAVDDIKIKGIFQSTATTPDGPSFVYADINDIWDFVQFDRRTNPKTSEYSNETIDAIKKTIKEKGYVFDIGESYNSGVAFPVSVDINGNIQIGEGNHRLIAAYEVAQETGKQIYVPVYVYPGGVVMPTGNAKSTGSRTRYVGDRTLYDALRQYFIDLGASEYSVNEKVGETFGATKQYTGTNYTGAGGSGGNKTSQENTKKFFDAIGVETVTYNELPNDSVFKTGVSPITDTPTTAVNEVVITKDQFGRDVTVSVNEDGYITLYRATDDPNRILDSDFSVAGKDAGSVGFGQQSYFSPNPMYAYHYDGRVPGKTKTYKFNTNIKPSEVLPFESYISDYPELAKALNIPEEYWIDEFGTKTQWNTLLKNDNAMIKMGYEAGGKRFLNDKLQVFLDNGIKAFGTLYTGTGGQTYTEYEIVPLIKEGDTLGIKPVSQLTTKEGYSAGKVPEAFIETPLDTPTNVVDDVSNKVKNLETELNNKYSNVIADIEIGGVKQPTLSLEPVPGTNSFVIKNLYIDDTLQGQGYGTQIMNDIIEFADSNNLQIELDISATNKSLATYYEKFGFELTDSTGTNMVRKTDSSTTAAGPTLNTDLVWNREKISSSTNPRWNDDIVPKNNVLRPNLTFDDVKRIIPQILDGTVSDIDFTRFGVWLMGKSPTVAFRTKSFNSRDAVADITKIVIFNGKSPIDLVNKDTLEMVKNWIVSDLGPFTTDITTGANAGSTSMVGLTDELILQFGAEEGPFANAQQRMKQTIINEHNKLYANADDYFILFRGGALTNNPIQSFSKDGAKAHFIGYEMSQPTIYGGRGVDAYFVNKYDFIDLHSLGLDYGQENEVIVYKEGVNKPIQKTVIDESVREFNYLDKDRLKFIEKNWVMVSDEFPKTGFINSVDPTNPTRNQTLRVMEDTPDITNASTRVQQVAIDFAKTNGLAEPNFNAIAYFNPEVGVQAADVYQGLPDFDDNAVPLYNKFIKETNLQYDALNNAGLQFELVDTDPYTPNAAGHQQMINDMQNGRLKVLATSAAGDIPPGSPMAQQSGYVDVNGRPMLNNDVFRAVHDTFGHGMRGNTFGPIGEYNAWLAHKEMYSPTAQRVMTTETLGQNTWVNFGPHMRTEDGVLVGKGDSGYIPPADRPFAPQKVAVMPEDIITNAGTVVNDASELVSPGAMNKVQQFISNTPDAAEQLWKATKFTMGKALRGLQVFDPGDIIIEAGLARLLPRLGLAAIAVPSLYAYVFYELAVLAVDVGQAYTKARANQGYDTVNKTGGALFGGMPGVDWKQLGKDTWSEMGEVSDDWSLSWKISEPIINKVFEEYGKMKTAKDEKDYFTNLDVGVAAR